MAKVPTVTMWKGTALVTVNESDRAKWEKDGFKLAESPEAARAAINAQTAATDKAEAEARAKADAEANTPKPPAKRTAKG